MPRRLTAKEEKVAIKISELLSPVDLNLDDVGFYLAKLPSKTHYNRLLLVTESAVAEQELINDRATRPEYFLFD